ncbi:hypothetical protein ACFQ51_44600 [Streptomyces kaempferi]
MSWLGSRRSPCTSNTKKGSTVLPPRGDLGSAILAATAVTALGVAALTLVLMVKPTSPASPPNGGSSATCSSFSSRC